MKKTLLLILSIIFLSSCGNNDTITNNSSAEKEISSMKQSTETTTATSHSINTTTSTESNVIVELWDEIENYDRFLLFLENLEQGKPDNITIISYTMEGDELIRKLNFENGKIHSVYDTTHDQYGTPEIIEDTFDKIIEKDGVYVLKNDHSKDEENGILIKQ